MIFSASMASKCMKIQIKIHAMIKSRKCMEKAREMYGKSVQNQKPKASQRAQGVQNEPRGVPEASRRRPKVSKKRQGGAKVDLVVFYNSKWEPKGIPKRPRASKTSPEASQRRPEGAQECQRSVQKAQRSI